MSDRKSFAEIAEKISSETNLTSDQVRYIGRKIFADCKIYRVWRKYCTATFDYIPMSLQADYEKIGPL